MAFTVFSNNCNSSVSMVTALWAGECMVQFLAAGRDFPLLQDIHTSSGAHPKSQSVGAKAVTHLHLVPWLRMSAAIPSCLCTPSWHAAELYCYHTYKSITSRKDGYLFVVQYFMQYHFIICLDKILGTNLQNLSL